MSTATPFPRQERVARRDAGITFCSFFERAPMPVVSCNARGEIVEANPAFDRVFHGAELKSDRSSGHELYLWEFIAPRDRTVGQALLCELLERKRDTVCIPARIPEKNAAAGSAAMSWTGWHMGDGAAEGDKIVFLAERMVADAAAAVAGEPGELAEDSIPDEPILDEAFSGKACPAGASPDEEVIQGQRWEAVGRLAGGVVHDFNNLLTGVMLYCDLLLSSFDTRDRRRRYADEIRAAITQASGLVQQLLVFARPQASQARSLCLNEIATSIRNLLVRLIGENIELELRLDPDLALVRIDHAQAQQILLNLVLNARDAMPEGGRITVETSNCKFQPVAGAPMGAPVFPCVLLVVGDNGRGMDAKTRQRLFEPFFTTKSSGKGTGLGLTTVHSIVTTNRGLIHLESEAGRGTRAMILLPRAVSAAGPEYEAKTGIELLPARRNFDARERGVEPNGSLASDSAAQSVARDSALRHSSHQDSTSPKTSPLQEIKKELKL